MSRGHDDVPAVRSTERITFLCPLPPHGLRRNTQYRSPQALGRLKDEYSEAVWCAYWSGGATWTKATTVLGEGWLYKGLSGVRYPWQRAHLRLVWLHHRQGPDPDNALASCKALIDTLTTRGRRPLGLVVDDGPEHLTVELRVEKVRQKAWEGVWVELESLSE